MAVNGTGYPINQRYTTDTGDTLVPENDQDIYYDYISGTQIHKTSGHVYALRNIVRDVSIYGEFDSSKASNSNNPKIGFKMISYTAPTSAATTGGTIFTPSRTRLSAMGLQLEKLRATSSPNLSSPMSFMTSSQLGHSP